MVSFGFIAAIILIVFALFESGPRGRIFLLCVLILGIGLPLVAQNGTVTIICHVGTILIGICCFIYLKFNGYF